MPILSYASTYGDDGHTILENVPLSEPPGRMVSDDSSRVLSSFEVEPGVWEHRYQDRLTEHRYRMIVRSA